MLVLSRKKNQGIHIGDDVWLVVVEIRGDKVRLGVEAPKSIEVHRDEVFEAIKRKLAGGDPATDAEAPCAEGTDATPPAIAGESGWEN